MLSAAANNRYSNDNCQNAGTEAVLMNGREWVVEAFGCEPERLRCTSVLQSLFSAVIADLDLHPVGEAQWHTFPPPGGVTGLCMLAESHLTIHTFPEHASLCVNLFCCTPRAPWDWNRYLKEYLGATSVTVRVLEREYVPALVQTHATVHVPADASGVHA